MNLRACIFKNCGNYINIKYRRNDDVKMFSFPKDPIRYKKWIELGRAPLNIPRSMYYYCSDHFDKKYFAVNNRRTVLVGEAFPNPYVETEDAELNGDADLNYYLYLMNKSNVTAEKTDISCDQDILVESTTLNTELQDDFQEQFSEILYEEVESEEVIVYTDGEKNNQEYSVDCGNKRKLDNTGVQEATSNTKVLKTSSLHEPSRKPIEKINAMSPQQMTPSNCASTSISTNLIQVSSEETDDMDADALVDEKHVTTFIFKGEEYVQMPKEYYVNEKIEVMKKLLKMERAFKAIKGHLNSLEI